MSPKVSVIIPVYNVEPYLRECLDSVIGQTLKDIEIICVDDGSADGSPAILEEYRQRDPRITVLTQENRGQSAARNRGMDVARGEYLYFIDSDDYVDPDLLEKTTALADEMKLDILVSGLECFAEQEEKDRDFFFDDDLLTMRAPRVFSGVEYIKWSNDQDVYPDLASAQLWRRGLLTDHGLRFEEGIIYEDGLFAFEAFMAAKRVYQIEDCFYHYRRWRSSTTLKKPTHRNVESYYACTRKILSYAFRESNTPEEKDAIFRAYDQNATYTCELYLALTNEEKKKVFIADELDSQLLRQIILNNSVSDRQFIFLRRLTWFPRNFRRGFRCLRAHGLRYTLRRVWQYMTGRQYNGA
ncbi:MAG: glycosyltransferase [Lachnospiraceae bacterium]|nr:glycosyltransferase [Lachnospiraceae bacterium]